MAVVFGITFVAQASLQNYGWAATDALSSQLSSAGSAGKIRTILDRWQILQASKSANVALWRDMMGIQLRQVSPSTLDRLLSLPADGDIQEMGQFYPTFIAILGTDIAVRLQAQTTQSNSRMEAASAQAGNSVVAQVAQGERITPTALGDATVDQTFIPITPCRVVDTRNVGGPIGPFGTRNFFFFTTDGTLNWFTAQGGVFGAASTACAATVFSYSPSAAVATITVTGQTGAGNLVVWGGANPIASASTLSYGASGDIANLAVVPWGGRFGTGPGGSVKDFGVYVNAVTPTNVVIDIVGYYTKPQATALDCTIVNIGGSGTGNVPNGGTLGTGQPLCPAGYAAVATACEYGPPPPVGLALVQVGRPIGGSWSACIWINGSGGALNGSNFNTETTCCRVPGR
jgi:hypothetical protein